jgi:hypothetical protein
MLNLAKGKAIMNIYRTNYIFLSPQAWNLYAKNLALELVDPRIKSFNEEQVTRLIGISMLCTQASLALRPSMSHVVAILTGDAEVIKIDSKPSYLTEWQFKDLAGHNFSTNDFFESKGTSTGTGTSCSYISDVLKDSIIQEGR